MSLEQASYLAQIIGAGAVVVSLAYVGFELRQNTVQLARGEANSALSQNSVFRLALAVHADLAQVWIDGLAGAHQEPVERLRFDMLLSDYLWICFHLWDRSKLGLGAKGHWSVGVLPLLAAILSRPGGSKWWSRVRDRYPADFATVVDAALAARPQVAA